MRIHRDGKRFRIEGHRGDAGLAALLKWRFNGQRAAWPRQISNTAHAHPPPRVDGQEIRLTWIGHSTVLLQTAGLNIVTDPFLSQRASPMQWLGPERARAPALSAEALPPIDMLLISHNHYDHMDLPGLRRIARHHKPHVLTPLGNADLIRKANRDFHIDELGWNQTIRSGPLKVTLTPALHWSKRGLFDANRALWGAFVIEAPGGMIYFAGDTGYGDGGTFRDVRTKFGPPRLSLLPIGAYEPRWFMKAQHMNPDEAAAAHQHLESRTSIAIHHGTVQLTDEAIDAPVKALAAALAERRIDPGSFRVPDIGETILIP